MTRRSRRHIPTHLLVFEINQFLRGWRQYFRYGNSAHAFDKIRKYAVMRIALFVATDISHEALRRKRWGSACHTLYGSGAPTVPASLS